MRIRLNTLYCFISVLVKRSEPAGNGTKLLTRSASLLFDIWYWYEELGRQDLVFIQICICMSDVLHWRASNWLWHFFYLLITIFLVTLVKPVIVSKQYRNRNTINSIKYPTLTLESQCMTEIRCNKHRLTVSIVRQQNRANNNCKFVVKLLRS